MPNLPILSEPFFGYEDVTSTAKLLGIKYPVFMDSRIFDLFEKEVERSDVEEPSLQDPVATQVLYGLRFLLNRFISMVRFRFSVGPGPREPDAPTIPVLATIHQDDQGNCFVMVSLDILGDSLIG